MTEIWFAFLPFAIFIPFGVGALVANVVAPAVALYRFRRLRSWTLAGIPLPAPDDPRWRYENGRYARLGKFDIEYNTIRFEGAIVGQWALYADAVLSLLQQQIADDRAARALAAIVDESNTRGTP